MNFMIMLGRIGADINDDDDVRLKKRLFVGSVLFLAVPPATLMGLLYYGFGEITAGSLLFVFSALSLIVVLLLGLMPHRYPIFLFCELSLVLLMPFLVTLALGGIANLNLAVLWSFLCPLGALVMTDRKAARRWFFAFLFLLASLVVLQPYLRSENNLTPFMSLLVAVLNVAGVTIVTFILLNYFVAQRDLYQRQADDLLLNILPEKIANILKKDNRTIADHYDSVSVLFADIVGFTPISADLAPIELIELLNEIFSHFDSLVEKYDVEKIKTIGDCYMAAAGLPLPRSDHALVITDLALDMRDYALLRDFQGHKLAFRIGLNSGPVVAGVIGKKKFSYDLWGDAVNTASRMESHGRGGSIQVTEDTYELIKDEFICEPRGVVDVKGKGEMNAWYVVRRRS